MKESPLIEFKDAYVRVDGPAVEPFRLVGISRQLALRAYTFTCCFIFAGQIYCGYTDPWLQMRNVVIMYLLDNFGFSMGHLLLHGAFIEYREDEMHVLSHHSFIHHYRDIQVYHKTWLETRISYFFDARLFAFKNCSYQREPSMWSQGQTVLWAIILPVGSLFFCPTLWSTLSCVSTFFLVHLLQSTVHEWYHNPKRLRKNFYWFPVYYTLEALETLGIMSTARHKFHHQHNLHSLDNVVEWTDMKIYGVERLCSVIWSNAVKLYKPGEKHMSNYLMWVTYLFGIIIFGIMWATQYFTDIHVLCLILVTYLFSINDTWLKFVFSLKDDDSFTTSSASAESGQGLEIQRYKLYRLHEAGLLPSIADLQKTIRERYQDCESRSIFLDLYFSLRWVLHVAVLCWLAYMWSVLLDRSAETMGDSLYRFCRVGGVFLYSLLQGIVFAGSYFLAHGYSHVNSRSLGAATEQCSNRLFYNVFGVFHFMILLIPWHQFRYQHVRVHHTVTNHTVKDEGFCVRTESPTPTPKWLQIIRKIGLPFMEHIFMLFSSHADHTTLYSWPGAPINNKATDAMFTKPDWRRWGQISMLSVSGMLTVLFGSCWFMDR